MDIAFVRELAKLLDRSLVQEIAVTEGDQTVRLRRSWSGGFGEAAVSDVEQVAAAEAEVEASAGEVRVTSGMVGIFRVAEGVSEGSKVDRGHLLGFIESMRLLNEISSPAAGVVAEMFVQDGSPVEYGQDLMLLAKQQ